MYVYTCTAINMYINKYKNICMYHKFAYIFVYVFIFVYFVNIWVKNMCIKELSIY